MGRGAKGFGRYAVGFGFGRGGWSSRANGDVVSVVKLSGFPFLFGARGRNGRRRNKGWGTSLAMGSRSVAMHGFLCSM